MQPLRITHAQPYSQLAQPLMYRVEVCFGFIRSALLLAVVTCIVLSSELGPRGDAWPMLLFPCSTPTDYLHLHLLTMPHADFPS